MRRAAIAFALAIARVASAQSSGWTGDGFELRDRDGDYRLRIGFVGSYKLEPILVGDTWQDRHAFSSLEPSLSGNVYRPWLEFKTSVELSGNPPYLNDAYVNLTRWKELRFQAGQFKTPFSRSGLYGHEHQLFPDRAIVASYFWTGRDKGATAYGTLVDDVQYWIGVFGGSPLRQPTTISGNYLVEARLTYDRDGSIGKTEYPYIVGAGHAPAPFGVSASLEGYYGRIESAIENFDPTSFAFTVMASGMTTRMAAVGGDVFVQGARYAVFAEVFWRRTEPQGAPYRSWGVWGEASYLIVPSTLGVGVRVNYLDPSIDLRDDTFASVEAQLAWYIDGPRVIGKLRYGLGHQDSPGATALGDVALPVGFVGTINVFTAQLNLAF
jgi:hypothetical protein